MGVLQAARYRGLLAITTSIDLNISKGDPISALSSNFGLKSIDEVAKTFGNVEERQDWGSFEFKYLTYVTNDYLDFNPKECVSSSFDDDLNWVMFKKEIANRKMASNEYFLGAVDPLEYDVALILAVRRSYLFNPDFAKRLFMVFLPTGELQFKGMDFYEVPILIFTRKPASSKFRQVVTLSDVLIPKASLTSNQLYAVLYGDQEGEEAGKALISFLGEMPKANLVYHLREMLRRLAPIFSSDEDALDKVYLYGSYSKVKKLVVLSAPYLKGEYIEGFLRDWEKSALFKDYGDEQRELILPRHRARPEYRAPDVSLSKININDEYLMGPTLLSFYNPLQSSYVVLLPSEIECFPNFSVKWSFAWHFFQITSLSAFQTTIDAFYHRIEKDNDISALVDMEQNLMQDIDEFYDVDFLPFRYKDSYEKLKRVAGAEDDLERVREKLTSLKDNQTLIQEKRLNYIWLFLTLIGILAGVLLAFPDLIFIYKALLLGGVLVLGGLSLYLWMRLSLGEVARAIKRAIFQ